MRPPEPARPPKERKEEKEQETAWPKFPREPDEPPPGRWDEGSEVIKKLTSQQEEEADGWPHVGVQEISADEEDDEKATQVRKNKRLKFERSVKEFLREGKHKLRDVGIFMCRNIAMLETKLGRFSRELEKHQIEAPGTGSPDLLPISLDGVANCEEAGENQVAGWVTFACLCLNFWYCTGWEKAKHLEHPSTLSKTQREMVRTQIRPAVERMLEEEFQLPRLENLKKILEQKGQDYEGHSWVVMERLDSEKVAACWPEKGKAAIQPLTRFLSGTAKAAIENPMSTILPFEDWPDDLPRSYVRADDEEWEKLVSIGYERGLFHHCPEEEVLRGPDGTPIVNGAGAVPKEKNGQQLQRFISIFCPLNAVSRKIEGEESTLPYVGQMTLLNIPSESTILVDSEDLQSAFNLFELPKGWRGLFCYQKQVRGSILGLEDDDPVYVALRTVPMGWLSAVGIVQAAIRNLAFDIAKLPPAAEIQKWKQIPENDRILLYLDSCDQLRQVSKTMADIMTGESSAEHEQFEKACISLGLPRNESKRLAGALRGSIQGGELRGDDGIFMLHPSKMHMNVALCLSLLGTEVWEQHKVSGIVGRLIFAGAFKRPLLAGIAEVFKHFEKRGAKTTNGAAYDEVVSMVGLMPFAFTNLKAPVSPVIHATDASPTGAGSCVANVIKRGRGIPNPDNLLCQNCRQDIAEDIAKGREYDCPKRCGSRFCSIHCYTWHREQCSRSQLAIPKFSERWSGPNAPLTRMMLRQGFDVLDPYNMKRGWYMDYFTEGGKQQWNQLNREETVIEHHAPDCKTMSRARGRPFWIEGRRFEGPQALRDEHNVMGFKYLKGQEAVQVRQGNKMALASVARCVELDDQGKWFGLEHPYRSFLWYMKPTVELARRQNVKMAIFSNCCFGGQRRKWTAYLTNNSEVYEALHRPQCPHGKDSGLDYTPYLQAGRVVYPTEEEAEYPHGLCEALARVYRRIFKIDELALYEDRKQRLDQIQQELSKYHRCEDTELRMQIARAVLEMEERCNTGYEQSHVNWLLSHGHYRGADIRLAVEYHGAKQLVPYPAGRWVWRDVLSFKWRIEGHINELEAQALFAHARRVLRDPQMRHVRLMVVIDSQVLFFALGKGRSPATRLNRILRRLMALLIAADVMIFPIWTLSSWNYADRPSRR